MWQHWNCFTYQTELCNPTLSRHYLPGFQVLCVYLLVSAFCFVMHYNYCTFNRCFLPKKSSEEWRFVSRISMWRIQISQCKELLLLLNCCCRRIGNSQSWARLESLSCKLHGAELCKLEPHLLQGLHLASWNFWLCSFRNLNTNSGSGSSSMSRWIRRFVHFFLKVHWGCKQPGNTLYYCLCVGFCVQLITRGTEQQYSF